MTAAEGIQIGVKLLRPGARLPARAYEGDAAFDLFSADELTLAPLARAVVGTGVALDLPPGVAALTLPRSGLAASHGISLVNAPGLIDPGYRGEVKLILLNTDAAEAFTIRRGDRIAQLLVVTLTRAALIAPGPAQRHAARRARVRLQRTRVVARRAATRPDEADTSGSEDQVGERRVPTIRVGAFIALDGRVLLVQQHRAAERNAPPYWLLPGGGVEFGESLAEALVRETREELGVDARRRSSDSARRVDLAGPDLPEARPSRGPGRVAAGLTSTPTPSDPSPRRSRRRASSPPHELPGLRLRPPIAPQLASYLTELPSGLAYLGRLW